MNKKATAIFYALAAALFYAINVPFSKLLLNDIPPTFLAAFLYIGAGIGVGTMYLFHHKKEQPGVRLKKADLPYTIGMVALDIIAPILLMNQNRNICQRLAPRQFQNGSSSSHTYYFGIGKSVIIHTAAMTETTIFSRR